MESAIASAWIGAGSALTGALIGFGGSFLNLRRTQTVDYRRALREAVAGVLTLRESLQSAQLGLFMAGFQRLDVRDMPLDEFYTNRDAYYDLCRAVLHACVAVELLTDDPKIVSALEELEWICGNKHRGDPIIHGSRSMTEESDALKTQTSDAFDTLQRAARGALVGAKSTEPRRSP
jgi:hypothetical protein